jgi:hypothetical protein
MRRNNPVPGPLHDHFRAGACPARLRPRSLRAGAHTAGAAPAGPPDRTPRRGHPVPVTVLHPRARAGGKSDEHRPGGPPVLPVGPGCAGQRHRHVCPQQLAHPAGHRCSGRGADDGAGWYAQDPVLDVTGIGHHGAQNQVLAPGASASALDSMPPVSDSATATCTPAEPASSATRAASAVRWARSGPFPSPIAGPRAGICLGESAWLAAPAAALSCALPVFPVTAFLRSSRSFRSCQSRWSAHTHLVLPCLYPGPAPPSRQLHLPGGLPSCPAGWVVFKSYQRGSLPGSRTCYGLRRILMAPSRFFWNISYACGAWSSGIM